MRTPPPSPIVIAALVDGRPLAARAVLTTAATSEEVVVTVDATDRPQWTRLQDCCELGVSVMAHRPTALTGRAGWAAVGWGAVVLDDARTWLRCVVTARSAGPTGEEVTLRIRSSSTETAVAPLLFHAPHLGAADARRRNRDDARPRAMPPGACRTVVRGVVERGDQRGRTIGFPTANLPIIEGLVDDGVWAGWLVREDGTVLPAAVSVGRRSTFYGEQGQVLLEAHVIDFDDDLYDEAITVHLGAHLREQRTFDGIDGLIAQLRSDVAAAAAWCGESASRSGDMLAG